MSDYASAEHAQIRIFDHDELLCTQDQVRLKGAKAPFDTRLFTSPPDVNVGSFTDHGYRVAVRSLAIQPIDNDAELLYARPLSDVDHTLALGNVITLSPRLVNETRAQFTSSDLKAPPSDLIGPAVTIAGIASFGRLSGSPTARRNKLYQVVDL